MGVEWYDDMPDQRNLILCQPDSEKGCAACCGLFNVRDIGADSLDGYCREYPARVARAERHVYENGFECVPEHHKRDRFAHICPYIGYVAPGRPGCMLHPAVCGADRRERSLYGVKICGEYLCPAHAILVTAEKELLIASVHHWYPYTVAIIDPRSFRWMITIAAQERKTVPEDLAASHQGVSRSLAGALTAHAAYLHCMMGPLFQYSAAEYALHGTRFSLAEPGAVPAEHRERVARIASGRE